MRELSFDPPVSATNGDEPFLQRIVLTDGPRRLGSARWLDCGEGIVQLLDLQVAGDARRQGHGRELLNGVSAQARQFHRLRKLPLRRVWMRVDQKTQVIGRSFLTAQGFHHVSTITGLRRDQDELIYVKSLD